MVTYLNKGVKMDTIGLVYLFDIYISEICKQEKLNWEQFKKLDKKYNLLNYIKDCKDILNDISIEDGMKYINKYISGG